MRGSGFAFFSLGAGPFWTAEPPPPKPKPPWPAPLGRVRGLWVPVDMSPSVELTADIRAGRRSPLARRPVSERWHPCGRGVVVRAGRHPSRGSANVRKVRGGRGSAADEDGGADGSGEVAELGAQHHGRTLRHEQQW